MKTLVKSDENRILTILESAGYEAYFVGGCVRDALMWEAMSDGLEDANWGDVDITTNARPEDIRRILAGYKIMDTGIKHGTVTVFMTGADVGDVKGKHGEQATAGHQQKATAGHGKRTAVQITTYRSDGDYSDKRHPDNVTFVKDLEEDLARRDFTINAIAMDCRGKIVDPWGGKEDVRTGILRAVGKAEKRFEEDALRIMRALRFAATLGFCIEPRTHKGLIAKKALLRSVSSERIYTEFCKLIGGSNAGNVIRQYTGILGEIIPELETMKGFDQHNPYHRYDVLEHCIRTMEAVETTTANKDYMKLAALFHDIGKPATFFTDEKGVGHFYDHPKIGGKLAEELLHRLKADSFTVKRVGLLVRNHDILFEKDEGLIKRRLNRLGIEIFLELLHIKRADNLATGNASHELMQKFDDVEKNMVRILREGQCYSLKDMAVTGNDLLNLGIKEGPEIGRTLDMLLGGIIEGTLDNEHEALLEAVLHVK